MADQADNYNMVSESGCLLSQNSVRRLLNASVKKAAIT